MVDANDYMIDSGTSREKVDSSVGRGVDNLKDNQTDFEGVIDELEKRLDPVLVPDNEAKEAPNVRGTGAPTQLGRELEMIDSKFVDQVKRLRGIIDRLDLP